MLHRGGFYFKSESLGYGIEHNRQPYDQDRTEIVA